MLLDALKRISFRSKVLLMGMLPLTIIGAIIGVLSFHKASVVVTESSKRVLADTVNRIDVGINVKVRQINEFMNAITESEQMAQLIACHTVGGSSASADIKAIERLCTSTVGSLIEVRNMYIYMGDEAVYARQADTTAFGAELLASLYENANTRIGKAIWSDIETVLPNQETGAKRVFVYKGLGGAGGEAVGLVAMELNPAEIGNGILTKQKILKSQITYITDRMGNIIYSSNSVYSDWRETVMARYQSGVRRFSAVLDGVPYYICAQYNGLTGWISFTMIREDGLFPDAGELRQYILLLVTVCVLSAIAFLIALSMAITTPLKKLDNGMKEVQSSDFTIQLHNDSKDEFGRLIDSFNFMVNRINILVNQVYQEKLAQKNAEIEALQAQINPHFLYNTLDSINWMLIDRDEMDISAIIVALGKLMQYSMDTSCSMVKLETEYKNVGDYLKIQKNRLEDRLQFQLELEEGLEDVIIPKLILQPMVENAIKHGIEPYESSGTVRVRSFLYDGKVHIQVADNGHGMSAAQLAAYRKLFSGDGTSENIGVRNVVRRLQLHFNNQCDFWVDSKPNSGLSVTIIIPLGWKGEGSFEHHDH